VGWSPLAGEGAIRGVRSLDMVKVVSLCADCRPTAARGTAVWSVWWTCGWGAAVYVLVNT
jgi:hypothetical protein